MNARKLLVNGSAAIAGTALCAAAMWLHSVRPEVNAEELEPIRDHGKVGEELRNRDFSVRVEKVEAAKSLAPGLSLGGASTPIGTDGVYLVVRAKATSHRKPLELQTAELETPGGFTFQQDPRPGASKPSRPTFQPMIWTSTVFVFELAEKRVEGAHLVVGTGGLLPQLSAAADIDLGLTSARAAELVRAAPERYDVERGGR